MSQVPAWQQLAEVGSIGALRAMNFLYRSFGRRFVVAVLYPIVVYFYLRHRRVRDASRAYLTALAAAAGGPLPGRRDVFRHLFEFAVQLFDRMVSWGDSFDRMELEKSRSIALLELARTGRGGILVGAHLGSFDLLRLVADRYQVRVNVLMFTAHADRINAFFARLDPRSRVRVLPIDPDSVQTAFTVRRCVEQGEFVGILADRVPPGGRGRTEAVRFLGPRGGVPHGALRAGGAARLPAAAVSVPAHRRRPLRGDRPHALRGRASRARLAGRAGPGAARGLRPRARGLVPARPVSMVQLLRLLGLGGRDRDHGIVVE